MHGVRRTWSTIGFIAAVVAVAAAIAFAPDRALSMSHTMLGIGGCACDPAALAAFHHEIATAETVAEAQELATPPLQLARSALARARWLAPGSASLEEREHQLRAGEFAIASASTPDAVAGAFAVAVTGKPAVADIEIGTPSSCSYSTLEIVAIVLGFILGVIPGIILLIILC